MLLLCRSGVGAVSCKISTISSVISLLCSLFGMCCLVLSLSAVIWKQEKPIVKNVSEVELAKLLFAYC